MPQRADQQIHGFDSHAGIPVFFERFEQHLPHGVIGGRVAQRFQRLHAHGGILILAGRGHQCPPDLLIGHAGLQCIQAINAHAGIEAVAIFHDVGEHPPHVAVINVSGKHERLLRAELQLHGP